MGAVIIASSIVVLTATSAEAKYNDHAGVTMPDRAWFGVIAKDAHAPADKIHHGARDVRLERCSEVALPMQPEPAQAMLSGSSTAFACIARRSWNTRFAARNRARPCRSRFFTMASVRT